MIARVKLLGGMLAYLLLAGLVTGCSTQSLTSATERLKISMVGVFERTPDGVGNAEPKRILFTLKGIDFIQDGGTSLDLFDGADEVTYRVISRPQIVFEKAISDYVGATFTGIRLTFDGTIVGVGKYEADLSTTLPEPAPSFIESLKVEKGQELAITVNVQWKDIITRDTSASPPTETMTPPSFRFALDE